MENKIIIINELIKSKKKVKEMIKSVNIYFYDNIGEDGCFTRTVKFKFNKKDLYTRSMYVNEFLIQLMLWEAYAERGIKLSPDDLNKVRGINNDILKDYYDKLIKRCVDKGVDIKEINKSIAKIQENLKKLAEDFSMILGLSFSIKDLCDLCADHPDLDELLDFHVLKNAQIQEIENDYNYHGSQLMKKLKTYDSPYKHLLCAGEGIKAKQFQQYLMCIGFQSNMDGFTYPKPIESSYMNKGLQKPSEYLLDSTMGRKAQIYQKKYTGDSGYFSRRLTYAALDNVLIDDPTYDCHVHSDNLIPIHVESKVYIKLLNGFYYKESRKSLFYKLLNYRDKSESNKLIGKTIYVRTPMTCACKHGICHKCYGSLSKINYDINVGIFGAETVASRLMQSILSSKHLLSTESSSVELSDKYDKYFTIDSNTIIFDPEDHVKAKGKNKLYLVYSEEDMNYTDSDDIMDDVDFAKSINKFRLIRANGEVEAVISDLNGAEFFIPKDIEKLAKVVMNENDEEDSEYWIPLNKLEAGDIVFYIEIVSKELKKPLNEITSLLDKKGHLGYSTLEEIVNKLMELYVESKLTYTSFMVHTLTAMRDLIRKSSNINKRPNFTKPVFSEDYEILTVKDSIYDNGSVVLAIAFEKLGQLLRKPNMYYRESKKSMIDPFFYETL